MLSDVKADSTLVWYCQRREFQDEPPCGILNMTSIDRARYCEAPDTVLGKGATIQLPACPCGASTFLKADYSLKELYRAVFKHEDEGMCAYVLPLRYVYNLQAHWRLYEQGRAAYAPILDMPPQALLEHPSFAHIKSSTVYAMWFGFSTIRHVAPHLLEMSKVLQIKE